MDIKTLPKMSREMLDKADDLLKEEKTISTRTGLRLLIEMTSEEFRAVDAIIDNQNAQRDAIQQQQSEIDELKRKNIVLFIEKNPKMAFIFSIGLIIVSNMIPLDYIRKIFFIKLGIPMP